MLFTLLARHQHNFIDFHLSVCECIFMSCYLLIINIESFCNRLYLAQFIGSFLLLHIMQNMYITINSYRISEGHLYFEQNTMQNRNFS